MIVGSPFSYIRTVIERRSNLWREQGYSKNNFKSQNAHDNKFGGAISTKYGGFFTMSCLLFDTFRAGMAPWYLV